MHNDVQASVYDGNLRVLKTTKTRASRIYNRRGTRNNTGETATWTE